MFKISFLPRIPFHVFCPSFLHRSPLNTFCLLFQIISRQNHFFLLYTQIANNIFPYVILRRCQWFNTLRYVRKIETCTKPQCWTRTSFEKVFFFHLPKDKHKNISYGRFITISTFKFQFFFFSSFMRSIKMFEVLLLYLMEKKDEDKN